MCSKGRLLTYLRVTFACIAMCVGLLPGVVQANTQFEQSTPAHTETLMVGSYIVDVNLYQDPPVTDQAVEVTVVPHERNLHLSGRILMIPGQGTDAVALHASLSPLNSQSDTLVGSMRMPVRGAWTIAVQLNGPQGEGQASFSITVAAPGAMPVWLAWVIAVIPLLGLAWLIRNQRRYRQALLTHAPQ